MKSLGSKNVNMVGLKLKGNSNVMEMRLKNYNGHVNKPTSPKAPVRSPQLGHHMFYKVKFL